MRVTILLAADDAAEAVPVTRTVEMRSAGAIWTADLAGSLDDDAGASPHRPVAELAPAAGPAQGDFVPLADVLPVVAEVPADVAAR